MPPAQVQHPRGQALRARGGLPIGNLTSQLFSNVYLTPLDKFVKRTLHIRHYGRYVLNSYLGYLSHFASYHFWRRFIWSHPWLYCYGGFPINYGKMKIRTSWSR